MTTSPPFPGDRPALRGLLPVPLATAASSVLATAAAALLGPDAARLPLAVAGTLATLLLTVAAAVAAHAELGRRATHARLDSTTRDLTRLLEEHTRRSDHSRRAHDELAHRFAEERADAALRLDEERARLADTLAQESQRLLRQHATDIARLTQEHDEERGRLTREHATEVERLTREHAGEVERLSREHLARAAQVDRERQDLMGRRDEEIRRLRDERDRLTADLATLGARLREAETTRTAALSTTANAAGRLQALTTAMLADLRAMEDRHHDEDVLTDLLHLDHRTAQAGRLADSVAVLTGARSGRRWARPIAMESILRGAMGRISGYRRVRAHSTSDTTVAGHAAEGVMHALAELLDNAANFSPPNAEVHVYVEEVPAGVIVSVEDSGLVMSEAQLRRAQAAVSGESAGFVGLAGTRLGLAVVGRLSRRYGLRVSYRPSARGGTGVLLLIPQEILVSVATGHSGPPVTTPATIRPATTPVATTPSSALAVSAPPALPPVDGPAPVSPSPGAAVSPATPPAAASERPSRPTEPTRPGTPRPAAEARTTPSGDPLPARRRARPERAPLSGAEPPAHHATEPTGDVPGPARSHSAGPADGEPSRSHPTPQGSDDPRFTLPRRRRGQTLAEAERLRSAPRATPHRPTPTAEETKARTDRLGSFRRAVRTSTPAAGSTNPRPGTSDGALPAPRDPTLAPPSADARPEPTTSGPMPPASPSHQPAPRAETGAPASGPPDPPGPPPTPVPPTTPEGDTTP
ncbi:ATP-binding protein [Streptomyces sp. HSG2]|uniref:sensor histidine kinase n=1 Tax=Streptomyces sp. HSG2 TaxID=2797167 RepID=UPI001F5BA616|nr:ATP-binding protein [Streptomyces sp. HSG2]